MKTYTFDEQQLEQKAREIAKEICVYLMGPPSEGLITKISVGVLAILTSGQESNRE